MNLWPVVVLAVLPILWTDAWSASLCAQGGATTDPIIGTWKLDLSESKYPENMPGIPKQQSETYTEIAGGLIERTVTRVGEDGRTTVNGMTWPRGGGVVKGKSAPSGDELLLVETLLAPGHWLVTFMEGGRQIGHREKVVSADGKVMRHTIKSEVSPGHFAQWTEVFRRQ